MFRVNRYTSIYWSIVSKAKAEHRIKRRSVYYEAHHIIPRALGGSDDPGNLVLLTAREHIFCHRLLTRMTSGRDLVRMKHAFFFILTSSSKARPSSRELALAREFSQQNRDPEWGENISRARLGYRPTAQAVEAMASALRGRSLSEDHKANISKNHARTAAKEFNLIMPSGDVHRISNLRLWCSQNGLNYQNAYLSAKNCRALRDGRRFIRL